MGTSRIRTDDEVVAVERAIAQLECANQRLMECPAGDAEALEAGLMERDEAVRAIAAADPESMEGPLAERLLNAFEEGRRIREKLTAFYRSTDGRLRTMERILAAETGPPQPSVSAVG